MSTGEQQTRVTLRGFAARQISWIFKITGGAAAFETAFFILTKLRTAARFQAFINIVARAVIDKSIARAAVASVTNRQIDANLRASTVVFCALIHAAEIGALILPADAIRVFVADVFQRYARALAALELNSRIAACDFARAVLLVAFVSAFGFTVAI